MNDSLILHEKSENKFIHYFSVLRCIAMLAVIGIHVISNTVGFYHDFLTKTQLFIGIFLKSTLQSWAVPIFIMISGALFLDPSKEIPLRKMYTKYILRLVLVLLTFGFLYALMESVFDERAINIRIILLAFKNVYAGKSWDHLWFIYMLIGLYIFTPPLKILINNSSKQDINYILIVLFLFNCFIPAINSITNVRFGIIFPIVSSNLFYYIAGYALHNDIIEIKPITALLIILICLLWCCFGQLIPSMVINNNSDYLLQFSNQDSIVGSLFSIAIFSFAQKKCNEENNFIDTKIAPLSFGVYIIHNVFINILYKVLHFTPDQYNVYLVWVVVYSMTLVLSLLFIFFLRKITIIRKYLL